MAFGPEDGRALRDRATMPDASRDTLAAAAEAFIRGAQAAPRDVVRTALDELAPAIRDAQGEGLLIVANVAGYLVEQGADPGAAAPAFAERLVLVASGAARLTEAARVEAAAQRSTDPFEDDRDEERLFEEARQRVESSLPVEARDWDVLAGLLGPALAMLGASAAGRERALASVADLDVLAPVNVTGHWLGRFLRVLYDEPFVAVEPSTGTAIRGRMSGISENFQLNVLLMDAFPRRGFLARPRVSKAAVAVARGDGLQQIDATVSGAWDLFGWPALSFDGSLPRAGEPRFMEHSIWNEGTPADIPVFEGQRVIVLGPPSYTRTWQAQRDFARLRAGLSGIEILSTRELASLVSRLAASPRRA